MNVSKPFLGRGKLTHLLKIVGLFFRSGSSLVPVLAGFQRENANCMLISNYRILPTKWEFGKIGLSFFVVLAVKSEFNKMRFSAWDSSKSHVDQK